MPRRGAVGGLARAAVRAPALGPLLSLLERVDAHGGLAVLTYHRIADPSGERLLDPALVSATPEEFRAQVAFLTARRPLLTLGDLLAVRRGDRELPRGSVLITFDDAYRDFAQHAWPTLRAAGAPAVLFVATAYPGEPGRSFWWDRLHCALAATTRPSVHGPDGALALGTERERAAAMSTLRAHLTSLPHAEVLAWVERTERELGTAPSPVPPAVLTWPELRTLAGEGLAVAPHTRTHPRLDRVPLAEARSEILGSHGDLERELGAAPRVLAYPGGGYTQAVVRLLEEEGFEAAFTTRRGLNHPERADWLRLRRINVGRRTSLPVLRAQLLPRTHDLVAAATRLRPARTP